MIHDNKMVLLSTLFSGYNYGSSLQTYATKLLIENLGYNCQLVARTTTFKGRDFRWGKLFAILSRTISTMNLKTLTAYRDSLQKVPVGDSVSKFLDFEKTYLHPLRLSWNDLKKLSGSAIACVAGSDQLWDTTTLYIDPLYYLRYAPNNKKISFSTSMGRDFVPNYNKKKLRKWINDFMFISVREDSGVRLVNELCGRSATQLLDPTLLIDGCVWRNLVKCDNKRYNKYILAYFLDPPSGRATEIIEKLSLELECDVIAIPYLHDNMSYATKCASAGPIDFISLVDNAECVLTDSFHGTAFSINLHTRFYTFDRQCKTAPSQNTRLTSLLNKVGLLEHYEPRENHVNNKFIDFAYVDCVLRREREIAESYLKSAIETVSCGG